MYFPTAPREIRPADVSDPSERMKLQEAEEEGGEWQNFGWCVREEEGMTGLEKSVEFIGKIMEEEVLTPSLPERTCKVMDLWVGIELATCVGGVVYWGVNGRAHLWGFWGSVREPLWPQQ